MYQHILIATDGSELGTKALEHGLDLASEVGAPATIVTVTEPWSPFDMAQEARAGRFDPIGQFEAIAAAAASRILDGAAERAKTKGVTCDCVHVKDRYPAEGIIGTATEKGCDLIVMGSRGLRGMSRLLLGSQAYEVLTHCQVPSLVVR
jgi:nucleotide-binding universal stress UspA family protein